jgi:hypothetical protein
MGPCLTFLVDSQIARLYKRRRFIETWRKIIQNATEALSIAIRFIQRGTQFWRIYNTRESWVFGLCPSFSILNNITNQWLRLALSNGPNGVGVSHPFTWRRKQIQFPKRCPLYSTRRWTSLKSQLSWGLYITQKVLFKKNIEFVTSVAQVRDQSWASVSTIMKFRIPQKVAEFLQ